MKKYIAVLVAALALTACFSDAQVASENLSTAADQFEIDRRIVYFNGITNDYILVIEGRCSIEVDGVDYQLEVTCKVGPSAYKKHFLGLSDNNTYFAEQLEPADVSVYRYRVIFKPDVVVPEIDLETSIGGGEDG